MTADQVELIRKSFDALWPAHRRLSEVFYSRFFELAPDAPRLFPDDMERQQLKLMDMIAAMVGLPDDILGRSSERLAARATHGASSTPSCVQPLSGWIDPLTNDRASHAISDRARAYNASQVYSDRRNHASTPAKVQSQPSAGSESLRWRPELAANLCKAMIVAWAMTKFLLDCCKERRVRNYFHMASLGAEMPTVY